MPARDMAAYMRQRRARQKAEREATEPVVDAAIPRNALLKESDKDLSLMWAKAAAIGQGAVITKTHGRLDVLSRAAFEARQNTSPPSSRSAPSTRSGAVARYEPPAAPPRSMVAIGGQPGHGLIPQGRGYALPPDLAFVSPFALKQPRCSRRLRPSPMSKSGGSPRSKPSPPIDPPTPLISCKQLSDFSASPFAVEMLPQGARRLNFRWPAKQSDGRD
jgi:hypothetical protein